MKRDADMIWQMLFSKLLYLKKMLKGVHYNGDEGRSISNINDPTVIANSIRNIIECISTFHIIYSAPSNDDEANIIYNLWVHSGLSYRNRFNHFVTTDENKEKMDEESQEMDRLVAEIKNNPIFLQLEEKSQNILLNQLRVKDYKIKFNGKKVETLSWQQISNEMDLKSDLFSTTYTYFSLYAHPSNVSVFQFSTLMNDPEEAKRKTNFILKNLFVYLSIMVYDYIKYNRTVMDTFGLMNPVHRDIINDLQNFFRNSNYSIYDL
jgi:uncharacterized protein YxeA